MLPTTAQFGNASVSLQAAHDLAIVRTVIASIGVDEAKAAEVAEACISELKSAATALGFELVQRITPAARDGGRFDMEMDADA